MEKNRLGADLVIGPGHTIFDESEAIEDVVHARDDACIDDGCGFSAILELMRAGNTSAGSFLMEEEDGSLVTIHVACAPVIAKSLRQVNASDFSRGVDLLDYYLYSLALTEPEASMLEPFDQATDDIHEVIRVGLAILGILIFMAACILVFISHRITVSMTKPMYYLLEMIRLINR